MVEKYNKELQDKIHKILNVLIVHCNTAVLLLINRRFIRIRKGISINIIIRNLYTEMGIKL